MNGLIRSAVLVAIMIVAAFLFHQPEWLTRRFGPKPEPMTLYVDGSGDYTVDFNVEDSPARGRR